MNKSDLYYDYPEELIATHPLRPSRILLGGVDPREISRADLFGLFQPGDVLVVNNTKVEKRRLFSPEGLEILFVKDLSCSSQAIDGDGEIQSHAKNGDEHEPEVTWEVLFPSRNIKIGEDILVIDDKKTPLSMRLIEKGMPQKVRLSRKLTSQDFERWGEPALPPYIQKARGQRRAEGMDTDWYQTDWAQIEGSSAAPTASLHFTKDDLRALEARGVIMAQITLHIGLGTFLPVKVDHLDDHQMHFERVSLSADSIEKIKKAVLNKNRVWALGTTSCRAVESWAQDLLKPGAGGGFYGDTDLFIKPGYKWKVVSGLLSNFHQPESTLLALVSAFSDLESVKKSYAYAIEKKFRLFSYGDLTVWLRE